MKIELPWLNPILSPNSRKHWAVKVGPKQKHKEDAWKVAKSVGTPSVRDRYHLTITFHPPTKAHRDLDNCLASIKAEIDGIADAWQVNDKQFRPITIDFGDVVKHGKIIVSLPDSTTTKEAAQ